MLKLSPGQRRVVVYFISICWILLAATTLGVHSLEDQLEYEGSFSPRIREKRQQLPSPLDQIFLISVEEVDSSPQVDFGNNQNSAPGTNLNGLTTSQDEANAALQQQIQSRLPQVINNLIEAAAVQQPPVPHQLVRTVMNSGLRR